jgi:Ca2+-binding RTX toxin-like protein
MGTIHGSGGCPLLATTARTAVAIGAATLGLIAALAGASRADAAVTCSYDDVFKLVTIELNEHNDLADLGLSGAMIRVRFGAVPCPGAGGPPTVNNTNAVLITDNSDDPATPAPTDGNTRVLIRNPNDFAPGATQEQGNPAFSEIEFQVNSREGFDQIELRSDDVSAGNDVITVGTSGINWNSSAADPAPDSELTYSGLDELFFAGGPGNDVVTAQGGNGTGAVFAGPAHLLMSGDAGVDVFTGGLGNDSLEGGEGDDTLLGGSGDDSMSGGSGDDTIAGGNGSNDVADFIGGPSPVAVDLKLTGPQDTGAGTDVLTGVEDLHGSEGQDTLIGDARVNNLFGDEGDDTLDGGPGDDVLDGGNDVDTVTYAHATAGVTANLISGAFGGGGRDTLVLFERLVGSPFADDLTGHGGPNIITGLGGVDTISALGGPDIVNVRDGEPDKVVCGSENDSVLADRRSVEGSIDGDCEIVGFLPDPAITDTPPGGVPPGGAAVPDTAISVVLRGARSQRVLKQKGVIVKVSCPQEDCTARASGTGRVPRLQRARGPRRLALKPLTRSIPGGETRTLKLRLATRQLRTLRTVLAARKRPKLSVTVRVTDAAGNAAIRSLTVKATP